MPTISRSAIAERAKQLVARARSRWNVLADYARARWHVLVDRSRSCWNALTEWLSSRWARLQRWGGASARWLRSNPAITVLVVLVLAALIAVPLATPALSWLPEAGNADLLLGALLTAQASIAALSSAVMIFILQGVNSRSDVDDRMYREYIRRAWIRPLFAGSLAIVGITGLVLMAQNFISESPAALDGARGIRNLTLLVPVAFVANLAFAGILFERALHQNRPEQWRALRFDVNKRSVRKAVAAFLGRHQRAIAALETDEPDFSTMLPAPGEDSGKKAIHAVLGDARRAMAERQHEELTQSLDSIVQLVAHAMDELDRQGFKWSAPGSQPKWPPLRHLGDDLVSLRREVISQGDQDYVIAILFLDYSLLTAGVDRRCGEMFTVALDGYRQNYEIARGIGNSEFQDLLRDHLWEVAGGIIFRTPAREIQPYVDEMVRHQEHLLADAMEAGSPSDYEGLHSAFRRVRQAVKGHKDNRTAPRAKPAAPYVKVEQDYRIALMRLGGRALFLAEEGSVTDPRPYLNLARDKCNILKQLADDIAQALEIWSIRPEIYPLAFFCLRLLELVTDSTPTLNLHGHARTVQDWFEEHADRFTDHVNLPPDSIEGQRELAISALREAVRADEEAGD